MKRRDFLGAVGSAAIAIPSRAFAQNVRRTASVGVLGNENNPPWEGFRAGMRELGYTEGQNVRFEWRWSQADVRRFPILAQELVALQPDVIVASGTDAIRALKAVTSTIPIVMATSALPDKLGLVASLARPGGNVTGLSNFGGHLNGKRLELLKEVAPSVARVALFWQPNSPVEPLGLEEMVWAGPSVGVTIVPVEVRGPDQYDAAFREVTATGADALYVWANPPNFRNREAIAQFAVSARLATMCEERLFVRAGCLVAYAPSFVEQFRRAAIYVDRILKGTNPADLPVEQPNVFELTVNIRTATALGLSIPPLLLATADEVIE